MLLRSFNSRQVASCVRDLPQLGCGEIDVVRFLVSADVASEQKRVQYGRNRVVDKIEEQGGVYLVCS